MLSAGVKASPPYNRVMTTRGMQTRERSARFERRRVEILNVASGQINALGVGGMTLTGVARALEIDTSSVTYYFRRKDDLAFACLERTLVWMRGRAVHAAEHSDVRDMISSFVRAHLAIHRQACGGPPDRLALLSDMHSMPSDKRSILSSLYAEAATALRAGLDLRDRSRSLAATLVLLATVHWIPSWILNYADEDFGRVEARLVDILMSGLSAQGRWALSSPAPSEPGGEDAQSRFLRAATMLINRDGYHGASVEKIAAELGVSTGSFYHHLDNKDDLVLACFERSFKLIDLARSIGESHGNNRGEQLAGTFSSLLNLQAERESPLLRSSAYQALPPALRSRMLRRTTQMTNHLAGTISDGIAEGSVRAVDPMLAGHFFISAMNAAADLRDWASADQIPENLPLMMSILAKGLVN